MAKETDMSIYNDVLEPFRRAINSMPIREKKAPAATKLNFSDSNQSLKEESGNLSTGLLGKRKFSLGSCLTPDKKTKLNTSSETNSPVPASPWEARRLKIDLIAAKAQITRLEARVNQQHTLRKEMQILFDEEKSSLEDQHKRDERALSEMEGRLQLIRKREADLKEELAEVTKEKNEIKQRYDKDREELSKQIHELKEKLLDSNMSSRDQVSEMKKDMNELLQALEGAQSEVEMLKKELSKQTSKVEQLPALRTQTEKQAVEIIQLNNRVKELEFERDSFKDMQQQAKAAMKRLANMTELEREVGRLRASERNLRDAVRNKLLLEEQVHTLQTRVNALLPQQQQLHEAKVKLAETEALLAEWVSMATSRGVDSARAFAAAHDDALQRELTAVTDASAAQSKMAQLNEEVATLKYEKDKAVAALADYQTMRKSQESLIHRLQKRIMLVTRERDSYRNQLDCYERELSVTLCGETGAGSNALLSARVEQLEKALQGYRDVLEHQDQANYTKVIEGLRSEVGKWREECESARRDAAKLRAQRDHMQLQIERISRPATKLLHLADNPAAVAQRHMQKDLESAQEEIEKLKAALKEGGGGSSEEVAALQKQLESSRIKMQRMKEEFTSAAQEYRDACYMLLGYKIDRTNQKNYRLSSMYAESPEEYLTFTVTDEGIEMVHTEYSATLVSLVELHLHQHQSIPLFLSALTCELFTKTTMQVEDDEDDDDDEEDSDE